MATDGSQARLISGRKSGISSPPHTFYVAFCEAQRPTWWMRRFLKREFSHCMILQPSVKEFRVRGQRVLVENSFALEYVGYAIVQQSYHWIEDPLASLSTEELAALWASRGWRVVKIERVLDEDKTLLPICNLFMTCVTLAKCLMGVSCFAQTPYQLYRWMIRNGGTEIGGL